jgi:LPS sulfotransferase NodH
MNTVIVSSYRSGSSWLLNALKAKNNFSLGEFFNPNIKISQKISLEDFKKFNFEDKKISFSLIQEFQNELKRYFLIKIIYEQYLIKKNDTEETIKKSDVIIGLYRKNTLLSYISFYKATNTRSWFYSSEINKDELKVEWCVKRYNRFYAQRINFINWIKSHNGENFVMFSYEEIHDNYKTNKEKIEYVVNKIYQKTNKKVFFNENYETYLKKENTNFNYCDHFSNPEDFLKDQKKICFFLP